MLPLVQFIALLATAFCAGAAVYVNLVEHPARMKCSTEVAATVWAPSHKRAAIMQASLVGVGSLAGLVAWLLGAGQGWLVGALLILAAIPVTLLVIVPINKRLLESGRDLASSETRQLLVKWGQLHAIRSLLCVVASVIFTWKLVGA